MINYFEPNLDLNLLRMSRRKRKPLPSALGSMVDQYEALQNELDLALSQIVTQASIERQKAEILANQISAELKIAQDKILSFLNSYQKSMFDKIYSQVKISEESLKFKGTDVYDMSFVSNMNYDNLKTFNDKTLLQKREDKREFYRQEMIRYKKETSFAEGLFLLTDENLSPEDRSIKFEMNNQKNDMLKNYYLAAIGFYQESTIMGMLHNPTNNLENLKEFISYNEGNLEKSIEQANSKRLTMGEEAYANEMSRINYIERMVVIAKARLKYLMQAYAGKWQPPTIKTLEEYASQNNITFSKAVYELNQKSRQTLCIPDWILGIAEMYNQVAVFEEGPAVVSLNPYDERWIRKAREVVNLESEGVKYTAQKLFKAIDAYWELLTFGFSDAEDDYINKSLEKALKEDKTATIPYYAAEFNMINFDDDLAQAMSGHYVVSDDELFIKMLNAHPDTILGMEGFFKKVFRAVSKVANQTVKLVKNAAGVFVDATRIISAPVAKAVKSALDNTLGRILPDSIYAKISTLTDVGLAIFQLNINRETLRNAVKAVVDFHLIVFRIHDEMIDFAMKSGFVRTLDKYSGGLLTSYHNLANVPITLSKGGKINWMLVAVDALKVGLAVYAASTASTYFMTQQGTNIVGGATGLNETSLGAGILSAGALLATGQANFTDLATSGAKQVGVKSVVNNTALGESSLGRTIASIGVTSSIDSIRTNDAFTDLARAEAEKQLKEMAKNRADKELQEKTNGLISMKLIEQGYDAYNSDKTMTMLYDEAKLKYEREKERILTQVANISQEELEQKASAEADKFLKKKMEELYALPDKYIPQELLDYLMEKYGPRYNYDDVMTPDDFLNYQIHTPSPQRIFNVNYRKSNSGVIIGGILAVGAAVALFNLDS